MSNYFNNWKHFVFERHDNFCNQKYDELPYSFHLKNVFKQGFRFYSLLNPQDAEKVMWATVGHDLIEDGRLTYNDIINEIMRCHHYFTTKRTTEENQSVFTEEFATDVAYIIYCVTDEKGRNRKERKNEKYYNELKDNKLAVFVKLADIAANTLYSKMNGSDMYNTYKKEFPYIKEKLYIKEYDEFFKYVESL